MYDLNYLLNMIEGILEKRNNTVLNCTESALKHSNNIKDYIKDSSYYAYMSGGLEASVGFLLNDIERIYHIAKYLKNHE